MKLPIFLICRRGTGPCVWDSFKGPIEQAAFFKDFILVNEQ